MKFALILTSSLTRQDWICHAIAPSKSIIENLPCYKASVIKLPKSAYPGTALSSIKKTNCESGKQSDCTIVAIQNLRLTGRFNIR